MSLLAYQEQLVLLVKEYPPIYDKKDPRYKERGPGGVVSNIWETIYQQLRTSHPTFVTDAEDVKAQWGRLRDAYMSAMRRRKESQRSGAGAGSQEPWRLERQMKWIDDYVHLRQSSTNIPVSTTNMPESSQHLATAQPASPTPITDISPAPRSENSPSMVTESVRPPRSESAPPLMSPPPRASTSSRGRKRPAESPNPDPVEQGILDQLDSLNSVMQQHNQTRDASDNIGVMVACQHRTLTFEQQAIFLQGIQEAYLRALNHSYHEEGDQLYRSL